MKHEEMIQKVKEDTIKNENLKIQELDKEFFELDKELKYCEKDLFDLGFDPKSPELIPQFKDEKIQLEYMSLLSTRANLIKNINTVRGDLHVYKNSMEN